MSADRTRRTPGVRDAAEAAFKKATTKPAEAPTPRPSIPSAKELVSLRIDREVLDHFQEGGQGWQERINEALRKAPASDWSIHLFCANASFACSSFFSFQGANA